MLTIGRIPEEEEPDTVIIGSKYVFFARLVGVPLIGKAEPVARLMVFSTNAMPAVASELAMYRRAEHLCRGGTISQSLDHEWRVHGKNFDTLKQAVEYLDEFAAETAKQTTAIRI
ncbi:MAG TPA: hypothetical protein VG713_10400 [Pirellulales bacterium]|nr:hypothetical protein [Pirellulales bacterium]